MAREPQDADPVMICERCGTGFLVAQPHRIHQYPVYAFLGEKVEERCMGTIQIITRASAIRIANQRATINERRIEQKFIR